MGPGGGIPPGGIGGWPCRSATDQKVKAATRLVQRRRFIAESFL
jgi:hypothetical protein